MAGWARPGLGPLETRCAQPGSSCRPSLPPPAPAAAGAELIAKAAAPSPPRAARGPPQCLRTPRGLRSPAWPRSQQDSLLGAGTARWVLSLKMAHVPLCGDHSEGHHRGQVAGRAAPWWPLVRCGQRLGWRGSSPGGTLDSEAFEAIPPCAVAVWDNRRFKAGSVTPGAASSGGRLRWHSRGGVCCVWPLPRPPPFGALVARSADPVQGVGKGRSSSCSTESALTGRRRLQSPDAR